jgi:hypothetical protein
MRISILGLILLLVGLTDVSAQGIKKRGRITLSNGEAIEGWINDRNWERNPSTIELSRDSLSSDFTTYATKDINVVEIFGGDRYEKATVKKDDRPVDVKSAPVDLREISSTEPILLRVLVKGSSFDLYEFVDSKDHYFIRKRGEEVTELLYKVVRKDNNTVQKYKTYVQQLKNLLIGMTPPDELLKKITTATYDAKYLQSIVVKMNGVSGTVTYASQGSKNFVSSTFVGAGFGMSTLNATGTFPGLTDLTYDPVPLPFLTVGIDLLTARNLQKVGIRTELSYSTASYKGTKEYHQGPPYLVETQVSTYSVAQTNIGISLSLLYNFIQRKSYKVFLNAGLSVNYASYSGNKFTVVGSVGGVEQSRENFIPLSSLWSPTHVRLGVSLRQHWEAALHGQFTGSFTKAAGGYGLVPMTLALQVRYHF